MDNTWIGRKSTLLAFLLTSILASLHAFAGESTDARATDTKRQTQKTADEQAVALTPMKATYSASLKKGIPFKGSATRSLERQPDGTWLYRFDVNSFIADIKESVHLRWDGEHVIPDRYQYSLEGMMIPDRKNSIDFNWAQQLASGKHEGDPFRLEIPKQALDPLGYQLQLMQDLKNGKQTMRYQVVDDDDLDEDVFAVIGNEKLDSELGSVDTIKMEKVREEGSKRQTRMWFAPKWDYLLVRFVQVEKDGTRYEVNLESARIDGKKVGK